MNVWILQTGEPLHIDAGNPRPMRAMNLANMLVSNGHKVVLWSSDFFHQEKKHRYNSEKVIEVSERLKIILIPSPGYQRNIGPARLWDHAVMAHNLSGMLDKTSDIPDIAFIGYPPIETASVMGNWLKKRGVKYIVDVKDQWPNIFVEALPSVMRPLGRLAFSPYFYLAKKCMKNATGVSAMSKSFVEWAAAFAGRKVHMEDMVVPLTTPDNNIVSHEFEPAYIWWDKMGIKDDGIPRFCFVGSHSRAFDMSLVMTAARNLSEAGIQCQFVICGDGPLSQNWRESASGSSNVYFPGWVDRVKAEALGRRSLAAIAPYQNVDNFISNMPNKIIDSLAQGLPILSPLKGEVMQLISEKKVGMSYGEDFRISLEDCIKTLIADKAIRNDMSANAKRTYEKEFSYEIVYGGLVRHLEELAGTHEE